MSNKLAEIGARAAADAIREIEEKLAALKRLILGEPEPRDIWPRRPETEAIPEYAAPASAVREFAEATEGDPPRKKAKKTVNKNGTTRANPWKNMSTQERKAEMARRRRVSIARKKAAAKRAAAV